MIPVDDPPTAEQSDVDALLAFDRALAAGAEPTANSAAGPLLQPVYQCQRLLEAVWPRSVPCSFELPGRFGRFSIVRELGRGGFGIVFLAEDLVLGRQVALKVPRPEVLVTPDVRRRFLREAEAASRLDHPHIVPVYEVGEEGPICYIASAYCEGPTLAQWLRRQSASVPIRFASRLVAVLAAAVAHAHERGILHRDLKPGNILLQQSDSSPAATQRDCHDLGFLPRICDFGLAKLLDQVSQETRTGVPIGSADYMAPEQATGRLREHGPATDVYALGVILYELLTGRPAHRGETDLETLRLVSDQDPASPRALRPGLPRDLETIVLKCLEKRPARRYSCASELALDLERLLDGRSVEARPVSAWVHAGKWARRRPIHAASALLLGIVLVAVPAGLEWSRSREMRLNNALRTALERSRLSEADALKQRELADRERLLKDQHVAALQLKVAGTIAERGEYGRAISILDSIEPPEGVHDPRGFAWNHLNRRLRRPSRILPGLPSTGQSIALRADGRMLALSDSANHVYLLDLERGTLKKLPGEPRFTDCDYLVFSPDCRTVASLSHSTSERAKSEVKLWDVKSGALLERLPDDFGLCYQVRFSPDGRTLVTFEAVFSNRAKPIRAWKLPDQGTRVTLSESLPGQELKARCSPQARRTEAAARPFEISDVLAVTDTNINQFAAVTLESGEIKLFDSGSGYLYAVCRVVGPEVVFVHRINNLLSPDNPFKVDDISRLVCALTASGHARPIRVGDANLMARFSTDGSVVAVLQRYQDRASTLRLIDVATGKTCIESTWDGIASAVEFAFTPRGDALVVTGLDAHARVWDFNGWRVPGLLSGHVKEVWGLVFSPDGRTLVSSSDDGTLKLWDLASGRKQRTLKGHDSLVAAVAYSPDGQLLASAGWDRKVGLWNPQTGAEIATLSGHSDHVRTVAFAPDGTTLASADNVGQIRLWDVATRRSKGPPLFGHTRGVFSVAFAPEGTILYSGAADKTIRLWDWAKGRLLATWPAEDEVCALKLSPDGQTLAAGQRNGTLSLWDVTRQKVRLVLAGHVGDVLGIAYSPDGSTVASAGRDKTVRIWDPANGHEHLALKGHQAPVHAIAFSPDGTILATGSYDGAIELWRAQPERGGQKPPPHLAFGRPLPGGAR